MTDLRLVSSQLPPSNTGGPVPGDDGEAAWRRAAQVSVIGLFVIGTLWCAYASQHVLVPLLLAWAIATIVLPIVKAMQKIGIPRVLAAIAVTLLLLSLIIAMVLLLSAPVAYWLGRATYVGALLREKMESFSQPLALLQELQKGLNAIGSGSANTIKVEPESTSIVSTILSFLTPAISQFVLFTGALIFYLIYRQNLRNAVVFVVENRETRLTILKVLNDIDDHMTTYFGTFTLVNIYLGLVAAV